LPYKRTLKSHTFGIGIFLRIEDCEVGSHLTSMVMLYSRKYGTAVGEGDSVSSGTVCTTST